MSYIRYMVRAKKFIPVLCALECNRNQYIIRRSVIFLNTFLVYTELVYITEIWDKLYMVQYCHFIVCTEAFSKGVAAFKVKFSFLV